MGFSHLCYIVYPRIYYNYWVLFVCLVLRRLFEAPEHQELDKSLGHGSCVGLGQRPEALFLGADLGQL